MELYTMYKYLLLLGLVGVVCAQHATTLHDSEAKPCETKDGKEGRCVPFFLCDTNNTIIYDGTGVMDIRSYTALFRRTTREAGTEDRRSSFEAGCTSYLDQCCKMREVRKEDNPITPPYKQIRNPDGNCGLQNPGGVGSISTDDKVGKSKFGEFPWVVAILTVATENPYSQLNIYIGGGSLIHPYVVLTTAHHLDTTSPLTVRAGEWNAHASMETYPYQDRNVDSTIIHKDFNTERKNLFYDIALLFLTSPINTTMPNIGLACLPPPRQHPLEGTPCIASGWGKDKFGGEGRHPTTLKKVTLPVVEREQCQTQLRKTRLGHFFELHSSFMCAGGEAGIDTCRGDGGSPLMCPIEDKPNRYMQSGMVAWGMGCGNEGIPGVYVDVAHLRDWIDDKIISKGLDPKVYTF